MIPISVLRAMVAAGATVDTILAAIEADQLAEGSRVQARRARGAERQRRYRVTRSDARNAESRLSRVTSVTEPALSYSSSFLNSEKKEKEESKKDRLPRKTLLPDDWEPKAGHFAKAESLNLGADFVAEKADDLRNWAHSKAVMRADWDATLYGFLKPKEAKNGHQPAETLGQRCERLARKARQLEEAAELFPADDHIRGPRSD